LYSDNSEVLTLCSPSWLHHGISTIHCSPYIFLWCSHPVS